MQAIVALNGKTSSFFDHRDPKMVKAISERTGITRELQSWTSGGHAG
jgi:hypothetical protein